MCRSASPYPPSVPSRSIRRGSRTAVKLAVPSNRHGRLTVRTHEPRSRNPVRTKPSTRRASISETSSPGNTRTVAPISKRPPARLAIGALYAGATVQGFDGQRMAHSMVKEGGFDKTTVLHDRDVFKPRRLRGRACFLTHRTSFIQHPNSSAPPSSR